MKEWMLCVILIVTGFTGILAQTTEPERVSWYPWLCYTQWFDYEDPNGAGDSETLENIRSRNPAGICNMLYFIDVQTVSGVPAYATGQIFQSYDTNIGFVCLNKQQTKFTKCLDYKVRFACPCNWAK